MSENSQYGRINFPLYAVSPLSCNHVIVAGGGGSSNTGVFDGFAVCEIGYENNEYVAYEVQRHSTRPSAIMNCAMGSLNNGKRIFLAAGRDENCQIYQLRLGSKSQGREAESKELIPPVNEDDTSESKMRKRQKSGQSNGEIPNRKKGSPVKRSAENTEFVFDIKALEFVQTDFSPKDPCQNAVAFSQDSRLILTGGADGFLRIWNFPEMKLKSKIEISKKEISDIDISADKKYVSCVSKDGKCKIWNVSDGKLNCSLDLPPEDERKFLYKRCRFGVVEDKRNTDRLFVIVNPTNYKKDKSYLQHWTGPMFSLTKVAAVGETLSALAVSRCGKYLAVGSMTSGDIDIYISFSLQRLKHIPQVHKTFVTGLTFLPPAQPSEESVLANCDAAVVSISIDNQIKVHCIEKSIGISMWLAVVLVIIVLVATFLLCSYFDL